MTFDQLSSLIKAGFSEQQIKTVLETFGNSTPAPSGSPTTDPTRATVPTPKPEPSPAPVGGALPGAAQYPTPSPAANSPQPVTTPAANTTPAPTPSPAASPTAPTQESETVALLREMLGLVRQNNINSIGNTPPAEKDGAQVLAEILNPQPVK